MLSRNPAFVVWHDNSDGLNSSFSLSMSVFHSLSVCLPHTFLDRDGHRMLVHMPIGTLVCIYRNSWTLNKLIVCISSCQAIPICSKETISPTRSDILAWGWWSRLKRKASKIFRLLITSIKLDRTLFLGWGDDHFDQVAIRYLALFVVLIATDDFVDISDKKL